MLGDYHELEDECYFSESKINKVTESERQKRQLFGCIGSLMSRSQGGGGGKGTAFLISADIILTAGHNICVFDDYSMSNLIDLEFKFYPGINGSNKGYPFYQPEEVNGVYTIYVPSQYIAKKRMKIQNISSLDDFAFIKLSQKIEGQQFLPLGLNFSNQKACLSVYGYPSAKDEKHKFDPKNYQKVDKEGQQLIITQQGAQSSELMYDFNESIAQKAIKYKISTVKGHSGCPVTIRGTGKMEGTDIVVGVHNLTRKKSYNSARLITWDLLIRLKAWSHRYKCQPFRVVDLSVMQELDLDDLDCAEIEEISQGPSQFQFRQSLLKKVQKVEQITNSPFIDNRQQQALIGECDGIQTIIKEQSHKFYNSPVIWDPHTPFAHYFSIVRSRVTYNYSQPSNRPYQITSSYPIPIRSITTFHLVKYGSKEPIIFGFITKSRKCEQFTKQEKGSIPYWTTPNGESQNSIDQGGRLEMSVNKIGKKIRLRNVRKEGTQKKVREVQLDDFFVRQDLFIFVTMSQQGDCIQILT